MSKKNPMTSNRNDKLREVAILIASLDEHWGERLLANMPSEEAASVRNALKHLGPIDEDEQEEIVSKFQLRTTVQRTTEQHATEQHATQLEGVELDASLLARFEEEELEESPPPATEQELFETLNDSEMTTVVEMLASEHPQTIAIVLSRLDPTSSAGLLSKFPPALQADVLMRMANCHTADEHTVQVVETQLALWIDQHRERRQRMAAGLELVESILANTSDAQRKTVLVHLNGKDPELAGRLTSVPNRVSNSHSNQLPAATEEEEPAILPRSRPIAHARPAMVYAPPVPVPQAMPPKSAASTRPSEELDQLDDATLLAALNHVDRDVLTLALAGVSEALMKRVLRGLPRRQAGKMRRQLRDIGPTRLSDILAAQQELLESARQIPI